MGVDADSRSSASRRALANLRGDIRGASVEYMVHRGQRAGFRTSSVARTALVLLVWSATAIAAPPSPTIAIATSPHKSYKDAATTLQSLLTEKGIRCVLVDLPETPDQTSQPESDKTTSSASAGQGADPVEPAIATLKNAKPALIVTCGSTATSLILERIPKTPVLFCIIPDALDMPFLAADSPYAKRVAGIAMELSPSEQIASIARLCPRARNLGVLHSVRSQRTAEALRNAARDKGITLSLIEAPKDEFPKAVEALNAKGCDGVLMLPDATVYNSANVQHLLLWGIRQKRIVWTFSANIVKAGALAGQFPDNDLMFHQAVEVIQKMIEKPSSPPSGLIYLRQTQAAINERTGKMIGLELDSDVLKSFTTRFGQEP